MNAPELIEIACRRWLACRRWEENRLTFCAYLRICIAAWLPWIEDYPYGSEVPFHSENHRHYPGNWTGPGYSSWTEYAVEKLRIYVYTNEVES